MAAAVGNPRASGGGIGPQREASALFARMIAPPSRASRERINGWIHRAKVTGVWPQIRGLWCFAAETEQHALLDWTGLAGDATLTVTKPTFTAGLGFTGFTPDRRVELPYDHTALGGGSGGNFAFCGQLGPGVGAIQGTGSVYDAALILGTGVPPLFVYRIEGNSPQASFSYIAIANIVSPPGPQAITCCGERAYYGGTVGHGGGVIQPPSTIISSPTSTGRPDVLGRWSAFALLRASTTPAQAATFDALFSELMADLGVTTA